MISIIKQTILDLATMPAKNVTNANGTRVLSEDYDPPSPSADNSPPPSPPPPIVRPSPWKNIINDGVSWPGKDHQQTSAKSSHKKRFFHKGSITSRQQQALMEKAARDREFARQQPGYNSLRE